MFKQEYPKTKFGSQNRGFTHSLVSLIGSSIVLKKIACFVFHAVFLELLVKRKIHLL